MFTSRVSGEQTQTTSLPSAPVKGLGGAASCINLAVNILTSAVLSHPLAPKEPGTEPCNIIKMLSGKRHR